MRILFIGDIMGRPGREAAAAEIPKLREECGGFDFIIANGENSAGGFGLTEKVMKELFAAGVDILTNGNHVWDKKDFIPLLDSEKAVLRPAHAGAAMPSTRGMAKDSPSSAFRDAPSCRRSTAPSRPPTG